MTDPQLSALNTLIFLVGIFGLAGIVLGWVVIDFLRQEVEALHTANLRESERRGWVRGEHKEDV